MCFDINMFDQMNDDAIRVILEAQIETRRLQQGFVDTEHILLGMIALPEISTSKLMAAFNVRLPDARRKAEEISGIGTWETKEQISLPLTRLSEQVIDQSWQIAKSFGQISICPEHMLIGLLDEKDGNANKILEGLVSQPSGLREQCKRLCEVAGEHRSEETRESTAKLTDREQREVFYRSFANEIKNILRYSPNKGDGLVMTAHVVGKVLNVSRCLFICNLPNKPSECYEYCRPTERSCKNLQWPGTNSFLVSRMLQDRATTLHSEDEEIEPNLRDELRFLKTKSFFGFALDVKNKNYGFLVLQQCDQHKILADNELAFLQDIAKVVAEEIAS